MQPDLIQRGKEAEVILSSPLIQEFFEKYPHVLFKEWINAGSQEEREQVYYLTTILARFHQHFTGIVRAGKVTQERVEENGN